ncbi:MAG: chromosome segregation protein SMC [candidate division WOR-3 bacterium]|nr:chromosome segregation protein SMC [candidate division WOR-3 bacterium]
MRLKELRLYGFKSFPYKTILELSPGMTSLVGPNGCGKSNVLDGIRWVLGEQTLSRLRCGKSEDLIFAGSGRLSELGYADVSLIIENEGEFPDLPAEVELRRRYYRTGESSFEINREECRLKDIEAILRGGAAGGRLYSVFDATKLAAIVGGELHNLLESAAGVLGFREKRKESERKLDLVRRDLVRLEDIITERKRFVRSLARQRRRAQLYKQLREKLVVLEARKMNARFEAVIEEMEEKAKIISLEEEKERKLLLAMEGVRKELKGKDSELSRLLAVERGTREALDEVNAKLSEVASRLSSSRTRSQALGENIVRIEEENQEAERRIEEIEEEIERTKRAQKEAAERRQGAESRLEEARGKLRTEEERLAAYRSRLREARGELKELSAGLARCIEERTRERSRAENASSLASVARAELSKLSERAEALRSELVEAKNSHKKKTSALTELEREIREAEGRIARLDADIQTFELKRQERIEGRSKLTGQVASLRERIENQPRQALRKRLGPRFRGLMEEFLSYPAELEAALEAVLYDVLGFASATGMPDLSDLSLDGQAGLVLDRRTASSSLKRPSDDRFKLWLADKVSIKQGAPRLLAARLESWVLADLADLDSLAGQYPQLSFVSSDGTALRSDGVVLLGRPRGVLADRRRLKELEGQEKQEKTSIASLEENLTRLRKECDDLAIKLDEARSSYLEERSRRQTLEAEVGRLQEQAAEVERERERLRAEARSREQESESARQKLAELEGKIGTLESQRSEKEEALSELEKTVAEKEEALRDKLAGLNDQLLALGKEEEAEHLAGERNERLEAEQARLDRLLTSRKKEAESTRHEILELGKAIEGLEEEQTALNEQRKKETERLSGIDTSGVLQAKREKETELVEREAELEGLRRGLIELRTEQLLLKRERGELEPLVSNAPIQDQDTDTKVMTPEEVDAELAALKHRLEDLGPVNEYAAVQYEEEKAELDRLKAQHTDITQAAESLTTIIREIDEEARSRFDKTFTALREEFRRTFNFFFPGGEADLRLEGPDDPFNSPINITARPEGKQLKRLSQLSDGERTMLGISLLFAFYGVRPAPFLFIDELDAPLDDANVLKFASYLSHIKEHIQVFVITHNKRTMEKADTIYGVTMEDPGVSKVISVRLKDVKRHHVAVEET